MENTQNNAALLVQHNASESQVQGLLGSTPGAPSDIFGSHIVAAGNFKIACDTLKDWLLKSNLRREQLVSISASETTTVDGDAVVAVVFRKSQDPSMTTSFEGLQYHLISSVKSWDEQYGEALAAINEQRGEIIALTNTPRNIGQINIQIVWYITPLANNTSVNVYTYKRFSSKGDSQEALEQAKAYLNEWVAPHNLVSVSVFEEDHPNSTKGIVNVVILQRGAGDKSNASVAADIVGSIYDWKVITNDAGWEVVLSQVAAACELKDRATVSTFNWSTKGEDTYAAAVLSWSKTHEDMLVDSERGGCSCIIF